MASFENTKPGFLEEIFGAFAVSGKMQQIPKQPELILLDQTVKEFGIAALQTVREGFGVIIHERGEAYRG